MADDLFPELDDAPPIEPPPVETLIPPDDTNPQGSRWVRLTKIKRSLPPDHPWAVLYDDLVTKELMRAIRTGKRWEIRHPVGIIDLLEDEAVHQDLMEHGEAPPYNARQCIGQLALCMRIKPVAAPRESASA